jgi:hypothetical protein
MNLEHNQEILGEIKFNKLNLNNKSEWYNLNEISKGLLEKRILPHRNNHSISI